MISRKINIHDHTDFCERYEPLDFPSKEILRAWKHENEPLPEPYYGTEPDGEMFFYVGNTKIKVTEHFNDKGKPLKDLLEDVIKYSAKSSL